MKVTVTSIVFKKKHTPQEILHYIVDPDAPDLTLAVRTWHHVCKGLWLGTNIFATLFSCLLLILQSMVEFYDEDRDAGSLVLDWTGVAELLCVIYFTIDYLLRAYYTRHRHEGQMWRFIFDANNIIDVLTTIPFFIQLLLSASGVKAEGFRVIFLLRTFRIIKLARFHPFLHSVLHTLSVSADLLLLFVAMFLMVVTFAGTAFYYSERTRYVPVTTLRYVDGVLASSTSGGISILIGNGTAVGNGTASNNSNASAAVNLTTTSRTPTVTSTSAVTTTVTTTTATTTTTVTPTSSSSSNNGLSSNGTTTGGGNLTMPNATTTHAPVVTFATTGGYWLRLCPNYKIGHCTYGSEEISPYQSIPEAMYWAVVTVTTVGYKLETPSSTLGRVIAVITAVVGVLFFAAPATVLATNFKLVRRAAATAKAFKRLDMRITKAMLAQEKLKRELQLAHEHRNRGGVGTGSEMQGGNVRVYTKRTLKEVARFDFLGVNRPIYEVAKECFYVYPPLIAMDRLEEDGTLRVVDDFNPTTAQRILTMLLVLDSHDARLAARQSLESHGVIGANSNECDILITADPLAHLSVRLDADAAYPHLGDVVRLDTLENPQGYMQDVIPLRFVIPMPHVYPTSQVVALLNETRLTVTILNKLLVEEVDVPLPVDIVMASRFVRELSEIAHHRKSDNALIAYIHTSDAAELLKDFSKQFFPTADTEVLLLDGYVVDQQVLLAIMTSFPLVKLGVVSAEAANSYYRGRHLSVDLSEERMMEVNLTALSAFDDLGFGNRFRVQVPVCRVERTDVQFQLV